jgi:hypothetical protein
VKYDEEFPTRKLESAERSRVDRLLRFGAMPPGFYTPGARRPPICGGLVLNLELLTES